MAESTTDRLGLPRWTAASDTLNRAELDGAMASLEGVAAGFLHGLAADRPTAAAPLDRFAYYSRDGGSEGDGALHLCVDTTGSGGWAWVEVPVGGIDLSGYATADHDHATLPAVSATAPAEPAADDLWYDTSAEVLKRWTGTAWVAAGSAAYAPAGHSHGSAADQLATDAEQNVRLWQLEAGLLGATEGMAGWQGEAFLTGQDEVASLTGDVTFTRAATLRAGSLRLANMPAIGEPYMGGFFAGIIDTTQGNIIGTDAYQAGERYALIMSPAALDGGTMAWRTANADVPAAKTRWNGLEAQRALASGTFPAFNYCAGLSYPSDGGSEWYLPALDEMLELYRNLKPTTADNITGNRAGGDFPGGTIDYGVNPSSDPQRGANTASDPAQTSVAAFQEGGAEAFQSPTSYCWTATWYSSSGAWVFRPSDGGQNANSQTYTGGRVRPVRRVVL